MYVNNESFNTGFISWVNWEYYYCIGVLWDVWKSVESGKCYVIASYQNDDSKEKWMHTPSQEKLRKLRCSKFKRQKKQKRRPWVNFSIDGEVAGLVYFPIESGKRDSAWDRKWGHSDPILRCGPSLHESMQNCGSPTGVELCESEGPALISSFFFPVQSHHEGTPYQDLHLRHFVLLYICLGLDKWGVLLFSLLYVVRLQYFPSSSKSSWWTYT